MTQSRAGLGSQDAESVVKPNRCEQARQMHWYEDHYQMGQGFYIEKCRVCGLTRGEVKARHIDGSIPSPSPMDTCTICGGADGPAHEHIDGSE